MRVAEGTAVGHSGQGQPARLEHAMYLRQHLAGVLYVFQHVQADNAVEAGIGVWQMLSRCDRYVEVKAVAFGSQMGYFTVVPVVVHSLQAQTFRPFLAEQRDGKPPHARAEVEQALAREAIGECLVNIAQVALLVILLPEATLAPGVEVLSPRHVRQAGVNGGSDPILKGGLRTEG